MPVYSSSTLKSKINTKFDCRKLELPEDKWKKIIIPEDAQLYHRIHFKVKSRTPYKNAKYDVIDCFNQEPGQEGKGCPICDFIQELWGEWRIANKKKDVDRKKELQNNINSILCEEYWLNAIDIEDEEFMFQAVRFTGPKYGEYDKIRSTRGAGGFILRYKKEKGPPVKYTLVEDELNSVAEKLVKSLDSLKSRPYEMGGPVDLDRIARNYKSLEAYKAILEGGDDAEEGEESSEPSTTSKPAVKEKIVIDESEASISLDDVGMDLEAKPKPEVKKEEVKKETKVEDSLDLESLDLGIDADDISLDDEPKFFEIDAVSFKAKWDAEKAKAEPWITHIYKFLNAEKKLPELADLPSRVKGIYGFLKTQTTKTKIKE